MLVEVKLKHTTLRGKLIHLHQTRHHAEGMNARGKYGPQPRGTMLDLKKSGDGFVKNTRTVGKKVRLTAKTWGNRLT